MNDKGLSVATRTIQSASGTTDDNGNVTLVFNTGGIPQGIVLTGTLACPQADLSSLFTLIISGQELATWAGPNPFGPIQIWPSDTLTVRMTLDLFNQPVSMNLIGYSENSDDAIPTYPGAFSTTPVFPLQYIQALFIASAGGVILPALTAQGQYTLDRFLITGITAPGPIVFWDAVNHPSEDVNLLVLPNTAVGDRPYDFPFDGLAVGNVEYKSTANFYLTLLYTLQILTTDPNG